jgi:hypothetical protein
MATRTARHQRLFDVRVSGKEPNGTVYNNRMSLHATMDAAWNAAIAILIRWGQAQGALHEGTTVSIIDTRDGGRLFAAVFLGFEPNLLSEEQQ